MNKEIEFTAALISSTSSAEVKLMMIDRLNWLLSKEREHASVTTESLDEAYGRGYRAGRAGGKSGESVNIIHRTLPHIQSLVYVENAAYGKNFKPTRAEELNKLLVDIKEYLEI